MLLLFLFSKNRMKAKENWLIAVSPYTDGTQ